MTFPRAQCVMILGQHTSIGLTASDILRYSKNIENADVLLSYMNKCSDTECVIATLDHHKYKNISVMRLSDYKEGIFNSIYNE